MFDAVPRRYDLINHLFSLGLDQLWRRRAARLCLADRPAHVLDLCCGTGDLALQLASLARDPVQIVGVDFSPAMLAVARRKAALSRSGQAIRFVEGDGSALGFPDGRFDSVGIAFAFRNVTWRNRLRERVLAEVWRVLRPGGTFVIVETSQPDSRILKAGFHAYLDLLVAPAGGWISRHRSAYRYLAESAQNFHDADEVEGMLQAAGFADIEVTRLMGGVAAIHVARK